MAHWFHRNPIKATAPATFNLGSVASDGRATKICTDLREARKFVLDLLSDPNNTITNVETASLKYLSLIHGFLVATDETGGESKIRYLCRFKWTNTLLGGRASAQQDAEFEVCGILMNIALWYTKHAAKIAASEEVSMDEAKEVHRCLRSAAGIFTAVKEQHIGKLISKDVSCADTDTNIISAYISQSVAEAQEVTLVRAIELKHNSGLVSSIASETAKLFKESDGYLAKLDPLKVDKWRKYLQLKCAFYTAYAYCFHGQTLLTADKCGEAIRSLRESDSFFNKAKELGEVYNKMKGAGETARPTDHTFFRRLGTYVKTTLEKCERENGFIYFQKVPEEPPELELKATYGLASPQEFTFPPVNQQWTPESYAAFDLTKAPNQGKPEPTHAEDEKIQSVKEGDIYHSSKEQKNNSGCVIS